MSDSNEQYIHQSVVDAVVAKLKELPDGTKTSTSQVVSMIYGHWNYVPGAPKPYNYGVFALSTSEYFDLDRYVQQQAKREGIILDNSPWAGQAFGLPFNCPFLVKHQG